jgi:thiol-disulfide isomerase/thioredoxin
MRSGALLLALTLALPAAARAPHDGMSAEASEGGLSTHARASHDGMSAALLERAFPSTDAERQSLADLLGDKAFLVVTFFSASCPCQRAHDPRLLELAEAFGDRVAFVAVDAEANSSLEVARREKERRGYPFPILSDPEGVLADALGARFATHTAVIDGEGRVRYFGGIDDDRNRLRPGARLHLRDALTALLAGAEPEHTRTKAFGCFLRRR